ncbi:MAG: adenosylcobinamide-GDP ribazoletransferase [Planctomycetes bacterium]|nr:adenosylcobinamide-GDP ribazoletransferase [Planctomycetota bacterium]
MKYLGSIIIAFAMFSRLPMPTLAWNGKNMRYVMAAFPLIGVAVGAVLALWQQAAVNLDFGPVLRGAGFTLLPIIITGGIHMDGYCDVADALASHADMAKKREILKDPHVGAFAVISVCCYLLLYFALATELTADAAGVWGLAGIAVASRSLSGLGVVFLPCASDSGLGRTFHDASARRQTGIVLTLFLAVAVLCLLLNARTAGGFAVVGIIASFVLYRTVALRMFGGISGDVSGWFLQICELAGLAGLVVGQKWQALVWWG